MNKNHKIPFQVVVDVQKHLNRTDEIDAARNEAVLNIAKYVKDHPRARQSEIQHKVEEEVALFKLKIQKLS